jgi:signal transduction histidine kinase
MPVADEAPSSLSAAPSWSALTRAQQEHLETASAVAGRLAHDFGNLLTGILGFAELSLLRLPADAPAHRYLGEVLRSGEVTRQLLGRLCLFGRCPSNPGQPSELAVVLAEQAEHSRPLWGPGVRLECRLPGNLPAVAVPPDLLRQLLQEVLDNAREAIAAAGVVTVEARQAELSDEACSGLLGNAQPGPHLEVTVTDTGCGLSPRLRGRLFREPLLSTKPGHRGLGLAVVFGILRAQRGGFRLDGGAEGGTVCRLFLPVAQESTAFQPAGE